MMSSIDPIVTQKDEITALRSIFGKEFKLQRPKNIKKKFEPPCISVTIFVSDSIAGVKNSLQIWFDCPNNYPIAVPQISLKEAECVSLSSQESLLHLLKEKSTELLGTPMIHQLVEVARDYLHEIYKPAVVLQPSVRQLQESECENKQIKLKLQMLRERKDSAKKETDCMKYSEKCSNLCHTESIILKFDHCADKVPTDIYRGMCEGIHYTNIITGGGKMVANCFDGFILAKGCSVKVNQVSLQMLSKKTLDNLKNNWLKKLEEDFNFLYKLSHCNVLPYLAFRYQITEKLINKERTFELDIQYVTPNIGGMKLATQCSIDVGKDELTQTPQNMPIPKIRLYIKQILEGVRFLHEKNISNMKINLNSISIDKDFKLKIENYHIGKRFDELKIHRQREDDVSTAKKGSKRNDMMKVGKLTKKLFFYGVPEYGMKEEDIPNELMGFIDCTRSNIPNLHEHVFLCPKTNTMAISLDIGNTYPQQEDLSAWERFDKTSRIPTEFELVCQLGKGAFGDVVKVKNIYDSQYYAIKRVPLNALKKSSSRRTMKEVQLLSSLNHENIVRYYASWSEELALDDKSTMVQPSHGFSSLIINDSMGRSIHKKCDIDCSLLEIDEMSNPVNDEFFDHSTESHPRHFYEIESDCDEDSSGSESEGLEAHYSNARVTSHGYVNDHLHVDCLPRVSKTCKFLMIQMELCEGPCNTLHKYIEEEKLYLNEKLIWKFIREIVSGLEHIHSKNMIHRDLKPTNIFIDYQKKVKIGDLGLATNFVAKGVDVSLTGITECQIISSEKGPVGTLMYICPEMINHKPYTHKADMYSLGIIIFEMCHPPFATLYERYSILGLIRQLDIKFPSENDFKMKDKFKDLIYLLLNHDPIKRPSASELLQSNIVPQPEAREMELRQGLKEIMKNRSSNMYKFLLSSMFNLTSPKMGGYELPLLYQSPFKYYLSNTKPHYLHHLKKKSFLHIDEGDYTFFTTKRLIIRNIEAVFLAHGAVEFMTPLLSPRTALKDSQAFTLLDSEGIVVNLPINLRENFANFLLNNDIYISRRYAIDRIYQQQEYRRDHPKELLEAAFDIVSDYDSDNKVVECLYILNEIFSKLFNREHINLRLEINHTELFYSIMKYYKIQDHIQQKILSSAHDKFECDMVYLDSDDFRQITSLSDSQLLNLKSILTYCGRIEDLEKFLKVFFNKSRENECCKDISDIFNKLLNTLQMLDRFSSTLCFEVFVRPTYVPKHQIYQGFVFQLLLSAQDKFIDILKSTDQTNINVIIKYLKNIKKISLGGDYSNYLRKTRRQLVAENGDAPSFVSAIGLSIDTSTVIQIVYSIEQLILTTSESDYKLDNVTNNVIHVVVQYDAYFDNSCRDMLAAMWKIGLATVLYDKDNEGENYVLENKIDFFVKFLKKDDRRSLGDNRIVVKRNEGKGIGLEQISSDDCKTIEKVIEVILKEHKKKETFISKFEKEYIQVLQKQFSESTTPDNEQEIDFKKSFALKPEILTGKYVYVFVNIKEGRQNKIELKYFLENHRQKKLLRQKYPDLDVPNIQLLTDLNDRLVNISKWFQSRLPSQMYVILVELSYRKCVDVTSELSLRALKDPSKLAKIISKIESDVNYSVNIEKHWKDVLSQMWKEIQEAVKDKICKFLVYSQIDDNLLFVEVK